MNKKQRNKIYFVTGEAFVGVLHVRQRHPQAVQFCAAGQQFSL